MKLTSPGHCCNVICGQLAGWLPMHGLDARPIDSLAVLRILAGCRRTETDASGLLTAWATESGPSQSIRLRRLVNQLGAGHPLDVAIAATPGVVRDDHALAIAYGGRLGLLDEMLKASIRRADSRGADGGQRFLLGYLVVIVLLFLPINTLIGLKVLPAYEQIFDDFAISLPPLSALGMVAMNRFAVLCFWGLFPLAGVLLLAVGSRRFRRWRRQFFSGAASSAITLDLLGTAVAAGKPFGLAAQELAVVHWNRRLGRKLASVGSADGPANPGGQLAAAGLVTKSAGLLVDRAAATGNAGQALSDLATQAMARHRDRWNLAPELLAPTLAAGMGLIVVAEVLAVFLPLLKLIQGLS